MDCCLRVSLVSIVLAIAASAGDPYIPPQCEDVKQMWGLGDDWNRVMANLIAETNVYWVEKALHLFVDVFHADEASTSSTHSLQLSWMALNQSRGSMSFYDASPLVRQPFSTLTGETQVFIPTKALLLADRLASNPAFSFCKVVTLWLPSFSAQAVHVSSAVLREERARSTTDHDVGWRTLVVRLVSSTGHVRPAIPPSLSPTNPPSLATTATGRRWLASRNTALGKRAYSCGTDGAELGAGAGRGQGAGAAGRHLR